MIKITPNLISLYFFFFPLSAHPSLFPLSLFPSSFLLQDNTNQGAIIRERYECVSW